MELDDVAYASNYVDLLWVNGLGGWVAKGKHIKPFLCWVCAYKEVTCKTFTLSVWAMAKVAFELEVLANLKDARSNGTINESMGSVSMICCREEVGISRNEFLLPRLEEDHALGFKCTYGAKRMG